MPKTRLSRSFRVKGQVNFRHFVSKCRNLRPGPIDRFASKLGKHPKIRDLLQRHEVLLPYLHDEDVDQLIAVSQSKKGKIRRYLEELASREKAFRKTLVEIQELHQNAIYIPSAHTRITRDRALMPMGQGMIAVINEPEATLHIHALFVLDMVKGHSKHLRSAARHGIWLSDGKQATCLNVVLERCA